MTVAQLRTGHFVLLGTYCHRIGLRSSPQCQDCGFDDLDTAEHFLLFCTAHHHLREAIFGPGPHEPRFIFSRPADVADFVNRSGRLRPRM